MVPWVCFLMIMIHKEEKKKERNRKRAYVLTTSNIRESLSTRAKWIGRRLLFEDIMFTYDKAWNF